MLVWESEQQTVPRRLCDNRCLSLSIITRKVTDFLDMFTVNSRCILFISNYHCCSDSSPPGGGIMPNCGLKNRQPEQDAGDDKQEIKRLKFDENREREHEDKDSACKLSQNLETSEGTSGQEMRNTMSGDCGKYKQSLFKFLLIH